VFLRLSIFAAHLTPRAGSLKWNTESIGIVRNGKLFFDFFVFFHGEPMDIGVCMSAEVLADKLQARQEDNTEQAWNLSRWPKRFTQDGEHRLFVASKGAWRGYFTLSGEALFSPNDLSTPYTLLFDTRTWTPILAVSAKRFRSFTYKVPSANPAGITPT